MGGGGGGGGGSIPSSAVTQIMGGGGGGELEPKEPSLSYTCKEILLVCPFPQTTLLPLINVLWIIPSSNDSKTDLRNNYMRLV